MREAMVLDAPEDAAVLLDRTRRRVLEELAEPSSATAVARRLGLPRQRVAYHVKELERRGFLDHVEDRLKGNCVERVLRSRATSYLIAPQALGRLGADPGAVRDRFSSSYLVAVAARTIRDVAVLRRQADESEKRLPTMTLESEVRFASAGDRDAFAAELAAAVSRLVERYHDAAAPGGRAFRFVVGAYPAPPPDPDPDPERSGGEP